MGSSLFYTFPSLVITDNKDKSSCLITCIFESFLRKRKVTSYPPVTLMVRPQPVSPHLISKCPVAAHRGEGADSRQLLVIHEAIQTPTLRLCPPPVVSFAADELLLAVSDAIGPVPAEKTREDWFYAAYKCTVTCDI